MNHPTAADLADAATLRAAAAVLRRRCGGLAGPIAVLEEKAQWLGAPPRCAHDGLCDRRDTRCLAYDPTAL
jgi:hypothetical protein